MEVVELYLRQDSSVCNIATIWRPDSLVRSSVPYYTDDEPRTRGGAADSSPSTQRGRCGKA
jgi:hypothetical protein